MKFHAAKRRELAPSFSLRRSKPAPREADHDEYFPAGILTWGFEPRSSLPAYKRSGPLELVAHTVAQPSPILTGFPVTEKHSAGISTGSVKEHLQYRNSPGARQQKRWRRDTRSPVLLLRS